MTLQFRKPIKYFWCVIKISSFCNNTKRGILEVYTRTFNWGHISLNQNESLLLSPPTQRIHIKTPNTLLRFWEYIDINIEDYWSVDWLWDLYIYSSSCLAESKYDTVVQSLQLFARLLFITIWLTVHNWQVASFALVIINYLLLRVLSLFMCHNRSNLHRTQHILTITRYSNLQRVWNFMISTARELNSS